MDVKTCDLCDNYADQIQVADPVFKDFGGRRIFRGEISTVKAFEDNSLVRTALDEPGKGRVLVVDTGGSTRCAMVGDLLADLAHRRHWSGVIVHGCVRDSAALAEIPIGVKALAACPKKSEKRGEGQRDIVVRFAGISFTPGAYVYADEDGIVVAESALHET